MKRYFFQPKVCMHIGMLVNIALTMFKFFAGIVGVSKAMLADAWESSSDILATFVAYIGIRIGAQPADEDHPYGHGNAESIAAGVISLLIISIGFYLGISAIHAIIYGQFKRPLAIALLAAVTTIVVKEGLFRYTLKVGKSSNNPAVMASAWHYRLRCLFFNSYFNRDCRCKNLIFIYGPVSGTVNFRLYCENRPEADPLKHRDYDGRKTQ